MSDELPQGWASAPLGRLSRPTRPRRNPHEYPRLPFVGMEQVESHTRRLLGTLSSSEMKSTAFHFQPGDVLYGRLRPYLNKVLCADIEGLCSSEFIVLPPQPGFEPKYLAFYLSTDGFVSFANQLNQGDRPRVSFDQIADHEIPLPPLSEQRRIVAKLETLLGKVDACQQRLGKIPILLKRFRQAVLAAACSGRVTADWREDRATDDPDDTDRKTSVKPAKSVVKDSGDDLPDTWRTAELSEFIESSFYGPRFSKESYSTKGIPTVRTTDMGFDGSIVLKHSPCISLSKTELEKFGLQHGDLVVTRTGATIGKCALYHKSLGPAIPGAYLIRFRFKRDAIVPKFALRFLMSPAGQQLLVGGSTAVAQPNVNATTISQFIIPIPPLAEQQEIVRRVEALFALAAQIEARLGQARAQVDQFTPSLLAKAFRGQLVPQDPNDEPASALWERIRHQRKASS